MDEFKIVLFLCNWGPHAAFLSLQDDQADIPAEIKMVRIPCSGRITKSLLLKSFEMGADGVVLMGCSPGTCRYGSGTDSAWEHTEETRRILDLVGLGAERMRLVNFLPDQPREALLFLQQFTEQVRRMGKSPVAPAAAIMTAEEKLDTPEAIVAAHDVYACQECGKCTSACPLALAGKPFSPRALAGDIIAGRADTLAVQEAVNACLTCGVCYDRCPSAVNFPEFIRDMRIYYHTREIAPSPAHGGFFQTLMRTMTSEKLQPRRWRNLPENIRTDAKSKVLFYGGCAPYFDIFFRKFLNVDTNRILEDSLRLLNFFDIEPLVWQNERCCGHDLLWSGDRTNFLRLARLNAQAIADSGVEEIITACPECFHTLSVTYERQGVPISAKITHLHDFLEKQIDKGAVGFKSLDKQIAFQDACRQTRLCNQGDLPRKLLGRLTGDGRTGGRDLNAASMCCGNSAWIGCDAFSKKMQTERISRVRQGGSDLMITACPKCQVHLRCAMEDAVHGDDLKMEIMDLTSAIAQTIYWE